MTEQEDQRRAAATAFVARMDAEAWKASHPDWKHWVIPCDCQRGCSAPFCTNRRAVGGAREESA